MVLERHGNLWEKGGFKSSRSPRKLSIRDRPIENSVLALLPALPVRDTAGNIIEIQPHCFRNTQDPDILRREVFPNRPDQRPPILDSWPTSGWQNPQGPDRKRCGAKFFEYLRGDITYRANHSQFGLPDYLLGSRAGMYPPPSPQACGHRSRKSIGLSSCTSPVGPTSGQCLLQNSRQET